MKNILNTILRKLVGYQLSKFDSSLYSNRDALYAFVADQKPTGKILDTGSALNNSIKESYPDVTTIDLSPPADVIGSISDMPFFNEGEFDTVVCLETMEHVREPYKAMAEISRILKPGGKLIASTPFNYELHDEHYGDYWRFTRQGWELLLKDFSDVRVVPYAGTSKKPGWYFVSAKR